MLDLFLSNKQTPGFLYHVETQTTGGKLMFKATELKWNDANQENDETPIAPMDCKSFAIWYDALIACGWKIQAN
jgi:hypothetical protein